MIQSGSIIKIRNLVYKNSNCIDEVNKIRPMLVIYEDDEKFYLLKLSTSLTNEKCIRTKYKLVEQINGNQNYICLTDIYTIPLCWKKEMAKIDEKELLEIFKKFLIIQNHPAQDKNFKIIEQGIINKIEELEKGKKY